MKKLKIFLCHLLVFILGSAGIAIYTLYYLTSPASKAGLGGIFAMPAIILIYIIVFGILCLISLLAWLLIAYLRGRKSKKA